MIRGSYYNGFAPRDGMPLYPSLWNRCELALAPCLGPTGAMLRDWSGRHRHATINNATLSTLWTMDAGYYCLDGDGTDDNATSTYQPSFGSSPFALSIWVNGENASRFGVLFGNRQAAFNATTHSLWAVTHGNFITGAANQQIGFGVYQTSSNYRSFQTGTVLDASWHHVGVNWNGTTAEIYIDGTSRSLTTSSAGSVPTANAGGFVSLLAGNDGGAPIADKVDDARVYSRLLQANEIRLLASRRGIAYDLAPFRMPYSEQVAGFQAAWALRQRLILGGGGGMG